MKWPRRLPTIPIRLTGRPAGLLQGWFGRILLLLVLAWILFARLGPRRPEMPRAIQQSVDRQVAVAMDDLAAKAAAHAGRVAVLHLDHDDSGYATTEIRQQLLDRGVAIQPDLTFGEKLRDLIGLDQPATTSVGQAIEQGRSRGLDAVVFGGLDVDGPKTQLYLQFVNLHNGVASHVLTSLPPAKIATDFATSPLDGVSEIHTLQRWLVWIVVALLLPIFTVGFLREVVRHESNRRNLFVLTTYTAIDVLLLWLLLQPASLPWLIGSLLVGGTASLFYNVSVMTWALKMES